MREWPLAPFITIVLFRQTATVSFILSQIIFEYCSVNDTTWITVNNCTSCTVDIQDVQPEICIGESLILDVYVINTSGTGEWSIDSFPTGISPTIINGLDTLFDASNLAVASGTYKLKFTVADGSSSCYDSIYIIVDPVPTPGLGSDQSICGDCLLYTSPSRRDS